MKHKLNNFVCIETFVLSRIKRAVILAYCHRILPIRCVQWAFRVFRLAHR